MAVYVDQGRYPYGRMIMCHLLADTRDELDEMADRIGVARKWRQTARCGMIHYDICLAKRALAIKFGAVEADKYKVLELMRRLK
jgi:hypothetical protein